MISLFTIVLYFFFGSFVALQWKDRGAWLAMGEKEGVLGASIGDHPKYRFSGMVHLFEGWSLRKGVRRWTNLWERYGSKGRNITSSLSILRIESLQGSEVWTEAHFRTFLKKNNGFFFSSSYFETVNIQLSLNKNDTFHFNDLKGIFTVLSMAFCMHSKLTLRLGTLLKMHKGMLGIHSSIVHLLLVAVAALACTSIMNIFKNT